MIVSSKIQPYVSISSHSQYDAKICGFFYFPDVNSCSLPVKTNWTFPPSNREHYSDGPRLTPVSWKRWRRRPRTSATTWMLPKAWTPTKTRSITLQTEWQRLCDLFLPQKCFLPPVSGRVVLHKPPPRSPPFFLLHTNPRCGLPLLIKPQDACNLPPSPALCKICLTQSIRAAVPSSF